MKAASAATLSFLASSLLLAYGALSPASAQPRFEAPVIVAPAVATPVEPTVSDSSINSSDGQVAAPASLDQLVASVDGDNALDADAKCLATAVFYEARSESLAGQLAVANVVIGRSRSGRFPASLCGVVTQRGQFGFVRNGRMPTAPASSDQWDTAKAIAQIALNDRWQDPAEGALYFHASRVQPGWGREMVTQIGHHIFYR